MVRAMTTASGKGKGKRQGREELPKDVRLSKALSQILRHKADEIGLAVRSDGFVRVEEVLKCKLVSKFKATAQDLEKITLENDKQRFEFITEDTGQQYIRAVQGHSMKIVRDEDLMRPLLLEDVDFPECCVHGTYRRHLQSIQEKGLLAGGKGGNAYRSHVHFASYEPGDERVISGMRYDCEVAIWVDLRQAVLEGIPFFLAKNQVILTPGVDGIVQPRFFIIVKDIKTGEVLYDRTALAASSGAVPRLVCDELAGPLGRYRQAATVAPLPDGMIAGSTAAATASSGPGWAVLKVTSPAACGSPETQLLTRLCWNTERFPGGITSGPLAGAAVVYLHGFPDQSLDHRAEDLTTHGSFSSHVPRKLADVVLREVPDAVFVAFNFSGTPGSDQGCSFFAKTVSREVADAQALFRFLREGVILQSAWIHVVGLSTGAIVASLLRGCDPKLAVTAVAGLLDVETGLSYDFDEEQLSAFDKHGSCLKEFWLPSGSSSNPPCEEEAGEEGEQQTETGKQAVKWKKCFLRLSERYRQDFLGLDIRTAVQSSRSPLLVIHGDADDRVPIANGEALFAAAAEPKTMVIIRGGNHFLSRSKHFQKVASAIVDLVKSVPLTP